MIGTNRAGSGSSTGVAAGKTQGVSLHTTGRLAQAVPESETLLDLASPVGNRRAVKTAQLLKLLDLSGAPALRHAIEEALERETPRASSVAFLLRRRQHRHPPRRQGRSQPPPRNQPV